MTYRSYLLPNLKDIQAAKHMDQILPGLYVGNFRDSKDSKQLEIHKITHILSIYDDAKKLFKDKKYFIIHAADSPRQDLLQYVAQMNDFIHAARLRGGHVLIHCLAGVSRSVTAAAIYLLCVVPELNHQEALQIVRGSRSVANPNLGFQKQLQEFEHNGLEKERRRLAEKFRPRSAILSSKRRPASASCVGPTTTAGRLTVRTATSSTPEEDNLTVGDAERCQVLLDNYRKMVLNGEICGGDCLDDGASCPTGICRAHLRGQSAHFLRRGANRKSSAERPAWNVWSVQPEDQIRLYPEVRSTNSTPSRSAKSAFAKATGSLLGDTNGNKGSPHRMALSPHRSLGGSVSPMQRFRENLDVNSVAASLDLPIPQPKPTGPSTPPPPPPASLQYFDRRKPESQSLSRIDMARLNMSRRQQTWTGDDLDRPPSLQPPPPPFVPPPTPPGPGPVSVPVCVAMAEAVAPPPLAMAAVPLGVPPAAGGSSLPSSPRRGPFFRMQTIGDVYVD